MHPIIIKRIYDEVSEDDGYRILVDRLWPRGVSKERARLNEWNKNISPSPSLRKWFDHQEDRFEEFGKRYTSELELQSEELKRVKKIAETQQLTLLYGAKDPKINHAVVLRKILKKKIASKK